MDLKWKEQVNISSSLWWLSCGNSWHLWLRWRQCWDQPESTDYNNNNKKLTSDQHAETPKWRIWNDDETEQSQSRKIKKSNIGFINAFKTRSFTVGKRSVAGNQALFPAGGNPGVDLSCFCNLGRSSLFERETTDKLWYKTSDSRCGRSHPGRDHAHKGGCLVLVCNKWIRDLGQNWMAFINFFFNGDACKI